MELAEVLNRITMAVCEGIYKGMNPSGESDLNGNETDRVATARQAVRGMLERHKNRKDGGEDVRGTVGIE